MPTGPGAKIYSHTRCQVAARDGETAAVKSILKTSPYCRPHHSTIPRRSMTPRRPERPKRPPLCASGPQRAVPHLIALPLDDLFGHVDLVLEDRVDQGRGTR